MEFRDETLLDPPFAKDPPVKLNISAKTLGLICAILAALAVVVGIPVALALLAAGGILGGIFILAALGAVVSLVAEIIIAWGGYQMYELKREGKKTVIYGLLAFAVGSVLSGIGGLSASSFTSLIVGLGITFVLYYLVVISRFPDEAPLVPAAVDGRDRPAGPGPSPRI